MGQFVRWLLSEEQKEFFNYLFAVVLNAVFLIVVALLLWPLGKGAMAWSLTKGFWLFWIVVTEMALLLLLVQRIVRMDLYTKADAYIISGLVVSGFLQAGWSAFAANVVHSTTTDAPIWLTVVVYSVGVVSCFVAFNVVSALFQGSIYRTTNVVLAFVSFIVFSIWPFLGNAIYGWVFDLASAIWTWIVNLF